MCIRAIFGSVLLAFGGLGAQAASAADCKPLTLVTMVQMEINENGRPLLPVVVNGKPYKFLFDTGGVVTQIWPKIVQDLNLQLSASRLRLFDMGGNVSSAMTTLDTFGLGPLLARHLDVAVSGGLGDASFDGLLTPSLLHTDIDMDFGPSRFALFLQDHCEGQVVYWKSDAVSVIPITMDNYHINVPVVIDGHETRAVIDTGASSTVMDMESARAMFGLTPDSPGMEKAGNTDGDPRLQSYEHVFSSLSFGGVNVAKAHVNIVPDRIASKDRENRLQTGSLVKRVDDDVERIPVIIGMNVLKKLHIYMAFKERKLYVSPAGAPDSPSPFAAIAPAK